jgi:hypothetical protein
LIAAASLLVLLALPGTAAARDRNHDRIPDRWERHHHLSLRANQAHRDQDGDHLRNRAEFRAGDDPRDADSDDDGVEDGDENAGTIESFDPQNGRLVIDLFNGGSVAGTVTGATEIECEDEHAASASHDGADDNSGPGSQSSGPGRDGNDEEEETGDCTAADLVPGAVVEEAELTIADGTATYEEVELAG